MACNINDAKLKLQKALDKYYDISELKNIVKYYFEDRFPYQKELSDTDEAVFSADICKLREYWPLQYVVGKAFFYDRLFTVDSSTLIPRPETEELARLVIDHLKNDVDIEILDLGTGSGCISVILSDIGKFKNITAIDIDNATLEIAFLNAQNYGCPIKFLKIDFLNELSWQNLAHIQCIVSNPPYISVSERAQMAPNVLNFEPHIALFAKEPIVFYRAIAKFSQLYPHVKFVFLELNPLYADDIKALFIDYFEEIDLLRDMQGKIRFLVGRR